MIRNVVPKGQAEWSVLIHGNATATLPSETYAIACFQPEWVRVGFAKTLGRFYLLQSPRLCAVAHDNPLTEKY